VSAYLAKGPNPQVLAEDELSYLDGWLFHTADGGVRKECGVGDEKDRMVKRRGKDNKRKRRRRRREREAASRVTVTVTAELSRSKAINERFSLLSYTATVSFVVSFGG
jgi:hypothetical protein